MAGAIRLPSDRREPAIREIPASWIAERPSAGGFANVLETQPTHFSDLGLAEHPRRPSFHGRKSVGGDGLGARFVSAAPRWVGTWPLRPSGARRRLPAHGGAPAAAEFDSDPACLANDRVSGSDAERHGDVACAFSLKSEPFEILNRLGCPQHCMLQ
jgi:hypothetical protein